MGRSVRTHRRGALHFVLFVVTGFILSSSLALAIQPLEASAQTSDIELTPGFLPTRTYFPETGHHLSDEMFENWREHGDFTIFGYPITDPIIENGRTVQYFERARLEFWPENADDHPEWVIIGTQLGAWKAEEASDRRPFLPVILEDYNPDDGFYYFDETRHTLANGFKKFWDENGGLPVFGFPISEEFEENGFIVQYFERARFEWHPENAGTEYEILLGHLGKEYAEAKRVDLDPVQRANDAVEYDAGVFDPAWGWAMPTWDGGRWSFVEVDALNVRAEPNTSSAVVDVVYHRRPLQLSRLVSGQTEKGVSGWYELVDGGYVPAVYVDPLIVPTPPQTYGGHWVDVNLSTFWAIAYNGSTPLYAAIITAGRGDRTPPGVYEIYSRVENETMDSSTVGFPEGHPEYYYLENVKYTQYFLAGGFALHGNYWTPEANFGSFASNGCVGLMEPDARYFWEHLGFGSVVAIHY